MLARLILVLTIVPLVEVMILLRLAEAFSWGPTIALVIVTGVLGAALARREGLRTLLRIQDDLNAGRVPTLTMVEGVMILVAGVALVTPGILTDLAGFALLVPALRRWLARRLFEAITRHVIVMHPGGFHDAGTSENAGGVNPFIDVTAEGHDKAPPDSESRSGHEGPRESQP